MPIFMLFRMESWSRKKGPTGQRQRYGLVWRGTIPWNGMLSPGALQEARNAALLRAHCDGKDQTAKQPEPEPGEPSRKRGGRVWMMGGVSCKS